MTISSVNTDPAASDMAVPRFIASDIQQSEPQANGLIPTQTQMSGIKPPAIKQPATGAVIPSANQVSNLTGTVGNAAKTMISNVPAPNPPSSAKKLGQELMEAGTDLVSNHPFLVYSALGGIAAGAGKVAYDKHIHPWFKENKESVIENRKEPVVEVEKPTIEKPEAVLKEKEKTLSELADKMPVNNEQLKTGQDILNLTNQPNPSVSNNPVESGDNANPLKDPGADLGKSQLETTQESTNQEQPKVKPATGEKEATFPAETNTTKESGNLTNPAENPTQGGVEQIKKEVAPEKEFKSSTRIRMSKDDEERIKAIKEAGIAPTHQLTREEIANQQMHPEMKKIVEEGNVKIESNPELKSEIEKLKAGHKIPNGFVWIPDMGSGDIHFINTHGFEKYRQFKKEEMGGKPIGEYALNPKDKNYNPDLREKIKKWSERNYPTSNIAGVSEMTGEQKGKAAPEETNFFSKMGKLKPVAKTIAGVGGVMMALTELAQAREEAKHGNPNSAIGRVAKVATGFAPLATYTNETNSNEQEAMNKIRSQQKPIKGAVVPK